MSAKAGAVGEAEVVLQDGGNQARKTWVSSKDCQVEGVLAVAVGVIEADSFWRVAEPNTLADRNVIFGDKNAICR